MENFSYFSFVCACVFVRVRVSICSCVHLSQELSLKYIQMFYLPPNDPNDPGSFALEKAKRTMTMIMIIMMS